MPSSPRPASRTSWTVKGELKLYLATCIRCNYIQFASVFPIAFLTAAASSLTALRPDLIVLISPGTFCFTTNSSWSMNSSLHPPAGGDELRRKDHSSCMGSDERGTETQNTSLPESPFLVATLTLTRNRSSPHTNTRSTVRHGKRELSAVQEWCGEEAQEPNKMQEIWTGDLYGPLKEYRKCFSLEFRK